MMNPVSAVTTSAGAAGSAQTADSSGLDKPHAALKNATQQFESYFLHQMLQEMRKTIPKDPLLGDDADQQDTFQDMMDQNLSDTISKSSSFGLGEMLYNQLKDSVGSSKAPAVGSSAAAAAATPTAAAIGADAEASPPVAVDIRR
jgi:flagellar protein FlgJ